MASSAASSVALCLSKSSGNVATVIFGGLLKDGDNIFRTDIADIDAVEVQLRNRGERDDPLLNNCADACERDPPILGLFVVRQHAEPAIARVLHENAMVR